MANKKFLNFLEEKKNCQKKILYYTSHKGFKIRKVCGKNFEEKNFLFSLCVFNALYFSLFDTYSYFFFSSEDASLLSVVSTGD